MRKRILEQPIDIVSMKEAAYIVKAALYNSRQVKVITLNPEMIVNACQDFEFQSAINNADLIVPDGTGVIWAFKFLNPGILENANRVPGIELCENVLEIANELGKKIAIFGSTQTVLEKLSLSFKEKYPDIHIVKMIDGYREQEEDNNIASEIASENPDFVLVALGSPRQEIWINKYYRLLPHSIMIGVGGSLDIWSGKTRRAPQWMRDIHLEWLFRVITQPQRSTRILKTLPKFIYMVFKARFAKDKH